MIIGAQEYPWFQHYQQRQLQPREHLGEILAAVRTAGLDYSPVWRFLKSRSFDGPAIVETAFENGTPRGLPMEESHRLNREWIESSWNRAGAS